MLDCFSCFATPLVPSDHIELSREELKCLYDLSLRLNNGRLIVHGIFARADTKNNNKRVYPKAVLKREVAKFEYDHIMKGTALGELDHPNYASRYFKCLNLPNVSHQVLEVEWRSNQLWGTIEILRTPSGLLLWELYSQGIRLGVSSRGWASLRTDPVDKVVYVDDDFELITFDFVTEPSTSGAYLVPIQKTFRKKLPDQKNCTQVSHLGYGVAAMEYVNRLPEVRMLAEHVTRMFHECGVKSGVALKPPPAAATVSGEPRGNNLDKLLKYSHYVVHKDAPFLEHEANSREYGSHLAMFAVRAHLSDQEQLLARGDINAVILQEMALGGGDLLKLDKQLGQNMATAGITQRDSSAVKDQDKVVSTSGSLSRTASGRSKPPASAAAHRLPATVESTSYSNNSQDLESWRLHPNALFVENTSAPGASNSDSGASQQPPATAASAAGFTEPPPCQTMSAHSTSFSNLAASTAVHSASAAGSFRRRASDAASVAPASGLRSCSGSQKITEDEATSGEAFSERPVEESHETTAVAVAAGMELASAEVAEEFLKIKLTLARFTERYQEGQAALQHLYNGTEQAARSKTRKR